MISSLTDKCGFSEDVVVEVTSLQTIAQTSTSTMKTVEIVVTHPTRQEETTTLETVVIIEPEDKVEDSEAENFSEKMVESKAELKIAKDRIEELQTENEKLQTQVEELSSKLAESEKWKIENTPLLEKLELEKQEILAGQDSEMNALKEQVKEFQSKSLNDAELKDIFETLKSQMEINFEQLQTFVNETAIKVENRCETDLDTANNQIEELHSDVKQKQEENEKLQRAAQESELRIVKANAQADAELKIMTQLLNQLNETIVSMTRSQAARQDENTKDSATNAPQASTTESLIVVSET